MPFIHAVIHLMYSMIAIIKDNYKGVCTEYSIKRRYRSLQACYLYLEGSQKKHRLPKSILKNIEIGDKIEKDGFTIKISSQVYDILISLLYETLIGYITMFFILAALFSLQYIPVI